MLTDATFEWTVGLRFVVALAMGFLVGLERESGRKDRVFFFGGVRTFPIVALFGFSCAWLYTAGATLFLPAGLLAVTTLAAVSYFQKIKSGRSGATSEVSVLVTFAVGALALMGDVRLPIAIAVINTLLLSEKSVLESYVERLDRTELLATLKFLLVTAVIYPVLPDRDFTPYAINPARIWLIVILVSAVGYVGYLLSRKLGPRVGVPLSGLLGGIVSSTAVSVATGRLARDTPSQSGPALQAALLASSVMYVRLLVLMALLGGADMMGLDQRFAVLAAIGGLLAISVRKEPAGQAPEGLLKTMQNPVEIRVALMFAVLFVALKIGTGLAKTHFGQAGVLGLGALSGLADVDPFVLSAIQGALSGPVVVRAILIAVMVNTLAKGIYFASLSRANRGQALWRYGILAGCHVPLMVW